MALNLAQLELLECSAPLFKPNNIIPSFMPILFSEVPESVKSYARTIRDAGWKFYTVDSNRGMCYMHNRVITIPIWVFQKHISEKIWYISHELSHAYDECKHKHGPEFMEWLKKICPEDCIHHELGYKPRNARQAGIGQTKLIDLL